MLLLLLFKVVVVISVSFSVFVLWQFFCLLCVGNADVDQVITALLNIFVFQIGSRCLFYHVIFV